MKKLHFIFIVLIASFAFTLNIQTISWAACVPIGGGGTTTTTPPPPPSGDSPFLFSLTDEGYFIENDVMITYRYQKYKDAKFGYENHSNNNRNFKETDYYKLRLNPITTKDGVRLLLKEIKPDESHFDKIELIRLIHPLDSTIIVDNQTQEIRAIHEEVVDVLKSCEMNSGDSCLEAVQNIDDKFIVGDKGTDMLIKFDISGLRKDEIYLTLNTWGAETLEIQDSPIEAHAATSIVSLSVVDESRNPKIALEFHNIDPREIESRGTVPLGDALKYVSGDTLTLKLSLTREHFIDHIGLIKAVNVAYQTENLATTTAIHSNGLNVTPNINVKDKFYAHTVRGESIDLTFAAPTIPLNDNSQESYIFVSSGFYHELRTLLYPDVDSSDSYHDELREYVNELNDYLNKDVKTDLTN